MNQDRPLYNSQIFRGYLAYLEEFHPDLDTEALLKYAGVARYQVEDSGHWFCQEQVDRFQEILRSKVEDPELPRKVGRFSYTKRASGVLRQYALGFLSPAFIYRAMDKLVARISVSSSVKTVQTDRNKVEITFTPNPGVTEKAFQCENRMGWMESVPKLFTNRFAHIEHPTCIHRGGASCTYVVSWEEPRSFHWRKLGRIALPIGLLSGAGLFTVLPALTAWAIVCPLLLAAFAPRLYAGYLERNELSETIAAQSDAALTHMAEMKFRYNTASLFQELGNLTSIPDPAELADRVAGTVWKWLDYEKVVILLPDGKKPHLAVAATCGFTKEQEEKAREISFDLDWAGSKEPFSWTFRKRHFFVAHTRSDLEEAFGQIHPFIDESMGASSIIAVPLVYENESLGVLAAAVATKTRSYTQSDISLLMGIGSQLGVILANARSFIQLRESESKYRILADNATDLIFTLDHGTMTFTYMSPSAERFLGYAPEDLAGISLKDILTPESLERAMALLKEELSIRGPEPDNPDIYRTIDLDLIRKDGSILPAEVRATFLRTDGGRISGVLGSARNIAERRAAEREKASLERELRQAQKMEALGTLAGGIAHDFNNILAAIMGYSEMARMDLSEESPARRHLDQVLKASHRAKDLVTQILAFSRQSEQERRPVQARVIVKEALKLMRASLPTTIEIRQEITSDSTTVMADPTQVHQILMNLCTNAHHAMMDKGGVLSVGLSTVDLGREAGETYPDLNPGPYVRLSVTDTGHGMQASILPRIFDPYFTTKQKGVGTGLGLAVVHGIVKGHGGTVKVRSEPGKGSTFEVLLPRVEDAVEPPVRAGKPLPAGRERILFVDDEEAIVGIGKELLERLGYRVTARTSSIEALEAFRSRPEAFDLLITDMTMPNMTGKDLAKAILAIRPTLPVILCTGFSEQMSEEQAMRMGIRAFLMKPLVVRDLAVKIREALNGGPQTPSSC